jgi:hypothetical protein
VIVEQLSQLFRCVIVEQLSQLFRNNWDNCSTIRFRYSW